MKHVKAWWMNIDFHMACEYVLMRLFRRHSSSLNNFSINLERISLIPYHLIYGIICGYNMRSILNFISSSRKSHCPKRVYQAVLPTVQFYQDGETMGKELQRYMKKYLIRKITIEVGRPIIAEVIEL